MEPIRPPNKPLCRALAAIWVLIGIPAFFLFFGISANLRTDGTRFPWISPFANYEGILFVGAVLMVAGWAGAFGLMGLERLKFPRVSGARQRVDSDKQMLEFLRSHKGRLEPVVLMESKPYVVVASGSLEESMLLTAAICRLLTWMVLLMPIVTLFGEPIKSSGDAWALVALMAIFGSFLALCEWFRSFALRLARDSSSSYIRHGECLTVQRSDGKCVKARMPSNWDKPRGSGSSYGSKWVKIQGDGEVVLLDNRYLIPAE